MIVGIYTNKITDEKEIKKRQKNCHNHHLINSHHLKYYEANNAPFCEICCDLVAGLKKPRFSNLQFKNYREMIENYIDNPENKNLFEKYKDKFLKVAILFNEIK